MIEYLNFGFWLTGLVIFILGWLAFFILISWKLTDYIIRNTGLYKDFFETMRRMYKEKHNETVIMDGADCCEHYTSLQAVCVPCLDKYGSNRRGLIENKF